MTELEFFTMSVVVDVTEDDIVNGVRGDPCNCPVARALNRQYPKCGWSVGIGNIIRTVFGMRQFITIPTQVSTFVIDYDQGRPTSPFSFTLEC